MRTAVIGGGAAGFFLAVNLKEMVPSMEVTILERSQRVLAKVEVSGGGRCNCTNTFEHVSDLSQVYPRGHRLLKRLFNVFDYRDAYEWFERHGVRLTTQADGCVFPASQDAHSVINCFLSEARRHLINIVKGVRVESLNELMTQYDFVAVCTGGSPREDGLWWLSEAGHETVSPVPSLFTLAVADQPLCDLMGTVAEQAQTGIAGTRLRSEGPLLVTHWGVSGPAVLKLSSHGARYLAERDYKVTLTVNWTGRHQQEVAHELQTIAATQPQKQLRTVHPAGVPSRLWDYLLAKALGQRASSRWQSLNQKELNRLSSVLTADSLQTSGRAPFRDEYVTCGGVALSGVDPSTMESRHVAGLYFAGEVLDVDGITGGFNFQAAWTTAYVAAKAISEKVKNN